VTNSIVSVEIAGQRYPIRSSLDVAAAFGVSGERQVTRFALAEGVTARVISSGRPVVVPQVSAEPMLRDRVIEGDRREATFVAAPILLNRRPVGARLPLRGLTANFLSGVCRMKCSWNRREWMNVSLVNATAWLAVAASSVAVTTDVYVPTGSRMPSVRRPS
jgi:hypothetical protein